MRTYQVHQKRPQRLHMINWDSKAGKPHSSIGWQCMHMWTLFHDQGEVVKYFATRPQGASLFSQPHCHANCGSAQKWKPMWIQFQAHCHANGHTLLQGQMWIRHCGCGFSKWTRRARLWIAERLWCKWEGLRRLSMYQKTKVSGEIMTHIWIGTSSRRFGSMVKRDPLILQLSKWNKIILRNFWADSSKKIGGMSMNLHSLHLLHWIVGSHRGRWVGSEPINFGWPLPSRATQTALRKESILYWEVEEASMLRWTRPNRTWVLLSFE